MAIKKLKPEMMRKEKERNDMLQRERLFNLKENVKEELIVAEFESLEEKIDVEKKVNMTNNPSILDRKINFFGNTIKLPRKSKVTVGEYFFKIININVKEDIEGEYGLYDQFFITFSLTKHAEQVPLKIIIPYIVSSNPKSSLILFLKSFKPLFEGQSIAVKELINLEGICDINHHVTKTYDEYERLTVKKVNIEEGVFSNLKGRII